ncbi:SusE domain-containing protein [Allomuricauda sp. SCSIO 65647]|uniref:SusE domain-containing protein n=1 Tax=Allomuricauda sp. SCSIO 65647 TaxID=2908843 RepID=UPI001F23CF3C|nr:SusE domain-containing protein [Muricauda sp. SCSIO 65647]UJH66243.1 SusE domain-containing protein [Muricauda sp. SCSIO 65647]
MMKKIVKLLSPLTLLLFLFVGCEDDDTDLQIVPLQEDSFEVITPTITNINLNFALPDNPAFTLSWNDVASSGATYSVEASAAETFDSPIALGTTQNRTFTMTVAEFNSVVIGAGAEAFEPFTIHMRVSNGSETSETVSYSVSAYTETPPEISGPETGTEVVLSDLDPTATALTIEFNDPDFGDGGVVSVDYTLEFALPDTNFETVFLSATTNELSLALSHEEINTIALDLGLTPEEASNAVVRVKAVLETESGMIERYSDPITLSITPYDITLAPILYVVGAGATDAGWGWDTPVELRLIGAIYSGNINLQNNNGADNNFRFFTEEGNWDSGQNYPYYADRGYTIDNNLVNANDGDSNFAFIGTTGMYSIAIDTQNRTITLGEPQTAGALSPLGVVGSGYNNWGAFPDAPFYTTNTDGVVVSYVTLVDGEIKFRENNDWTVNYGDDGADGTLELNGANIVVTAGEYRIIVNLNNLTYTIEPYSLGIVGSAWNDWGGAGPDAKMFYDNTSDTFVVGVKLQDGEMKVRLNNDWGTNYGDTGGDGTAELNGDNIVVTAGFYQIRLDLNNLLITVEETDIWGIVGSGYNDWGNAGPDFSFTQYNPDRWVAQNVPLIDGEIKFRINEDWGVNIGDTGADGTLEDGGDNIAVTAGTYDIFLDFSGAGAPTYTLIAK